MNPVEQLDYDLDIMFNKLFGRREVVLKYIWNAGAFLITVDGEELEDKTLYDIHRKYDYVTRRENLSDRFDSYESMLKLIEEEGLDVYI